MNVKPIKPVFAKYDFERDEWIWGLMPEDFKRLAAGYGCAHCLEPFAHWVPFCPVCKTPNAVANPIPTPSEWQKQGE